MSDTEQWVRWKLQHLYGEKRFVYVMTCHTFSSNRRYLSHDGRLEVRTEIIRTVLYRTVIIIIIIITGIFRVA